MKYIFGDKVYPLVVEPETAIAVSKALIDDREFIFSSNSNEFDFTKGDGRTVADGLAVRNPSPLVMESTGNLFAGGYILNDSEILNSMALLYDLENLKVEPSADFWFERT